MSRSDIDSSVKFRKGLDAYSSDYSPFLQSCMVKAEFPSQDVNEYHDAYTHFATIALRIEIRRLNRLVVAYKARVVVPSDETNLIVPKSIEEGAKMQKAIFNFHIEAASFLVTCMQRGGFEPEETDECDSMYLRFMSDVVRAEISRLAGLKTTEEKICVSSNSSFTPTTATTTTTQGATLGSQLNYIPVRNDNDNGEDSTNYLQNAVQISKSSLFTLYHKFSSQGNIAIKVLNMTGADNQHLKRIQNEFDVCRKIQHQGIRKVLSQTTVEGNQALLLEWIDGKTITQYGRFSLKQFLQVAREIVSALVALHSEKRVHGNLTTDNILVNFDSDMLKIIGFSSSSKWNDRSCALSVSEGRFGGDLRFMSPEQTGHTNRTVDFRSDLYSLGIIFYSMLSGSPPYNSGKLSDISYMHLFCDAAPLNVIDTSIPALLSDFVSKLMQKDVEDRYRSTKGIMFDLEMMLSEIVNDPSLNSLVLAKHDIPQTFLVSQKLYGRSSENEQLLQVFDKVCAGSFELLLITGPSGVGKSSLALEIHKPIVKKRGFLIKGKYDQVHHNEPYSALLEAFRNFFDILLAEDDDALTLYRKAIVEAIGDEGKVLTDVIGNLQKIIGTQNSPDEAIGNDAKNRFNYVFRNFIRSICSERYPVVILLDDLQWADIDSLELLHTLVSDKSIKFIMIIGVYRSDEINNDTNHPLSLTLSKMKETIRIPLTRIEISNLDNEEINILVSDTLSMSPLETFPLTIYINERTDGNVLYVMQYLKFLWEDGFLFFCLNNGKWLWKDLDMKAVADSVTDFIVKTILKLDKETLNVVKAASCLGYKFSLSTLKLIAHKPAALENAINAGMFVPSTDRKTKYRFAHDAILQVARSLIPSEDRLSTHLYIGRLLWKKTLVPFSMSENKDLFVVVCLLNTALDLIIDPLERVEVAKLNLSAGIKAMSSTAFKPAAEYLTAGIKILGSDHWNKNYDLTLELYNAAAKAAYCSKDSLSLQSLTVDIFIQARCLQDKMHSYSLHIKVLHDMHKYQEILNVGLNVLNQLGEQFPSQPNHDFLKQKLFEVSGTIKEDIFNPSSLRTMKNDHLAISKMKIFALIYHAAYFVMPTLLSLISIRTVELTLANGICKHSAIGFALVASDLCNYQKMKEGYSCATLALRLLEMCPSKEVLPSVYLTVYQYVTYWTDHIHGALEPFLHAAQIALEAGCNDLSYLNYSSYCDLMLCSGGSLTKVEERLEEFEVNFQLKKKAHMCTHQTVLNYLGKGSENSAFLTGDMFDLRTFDPKDSNGAECAFIYLHSIMLAFHFHEFDKAKEFAESCRKFIQYVDRNLTKIYFIFYDGMSKLAVATRDNEVDGKWKDDVKECISELRKYAEISPVNFLNKLRLLEAGLEAVENNFVQSTAYYKEAVILSKAQNFTNEEALALEQAATFYLRIGERKDAVTMLNESYKAYQRWGARAKMSQLAKMYPEINFENSICSNFVIDVANRSSDSVSDMSRPSSCTSQSLTRGHKRVRFSS